MINRLYKYALVVLRQILYIGQIWSKTKEKGLIYCQSLTFQIIISFYTTQKQPLLLESA